MQNVSNQLKIENFIKTRLKDHKTISEASRNIDEFRKTYGKAKLPIQDIEGKLPHRHPSIIHQLSKVVKTVVSHRKLEKIIQFSEKETGID